MVLMPTHNVFMSFYRTKVSLGSCLWFQASLTQWLRKRPFWDFAGVTLADDDTNLMLSEGDSHGKDFWGGHGLNLDGGRRNMLTGICTSRKRRWLTGLTWLKTEIMIYRPTRPSSRDNFSLLCSGRKRWLLGWRLWLKQELSARKKDNKAQQWGWWL